MSSGPSLIYICRFILSSAIPLLSSVLTSALNSFRRRRDPCAQSNRKRFPSTHCLLFPAHCFISDNGMIRLPTSAVAGSSTNTRRVVTPVLGCTS
jgi:hypothetical protein